MKNYARLLISLSMIVNMGMLICAVTYQKATTIKHEYPPKPITKTATPVQAPTQDLSVLLTTPSKPSSSLFGPKPSPIIGVPIPITTVDPGKAQSYENKLYAYSNTFDSLVIPEPENYSSTAQYTTALTTYKQALQPSFDAFKSAASIYSTALKNANKTVAANIVDTHIAYEQALFNMVTAPASESLQEAWETAADNFIRALYTANDSAAARDIAEEVYGDELAKFMYYYYPPKLYTDKAVARQMAIKYYGESVARSYYPELFQ